MKRKFQWTDGKDHYGAPNINYDHEACGLEKLIEYGDPEASYSFDDFMVFKDKETGDIYCANDSGCSCPTPFEAIKGLDDMNHCPDAEILKKHFDDWNHSVGYGSGERPMKNKIDGHMELERVFKAEAK